MVKPRVYHQPDQFEKNPGRSCVCVNAQVFKTACARALLLPLLPLLFVENFRSEGAFARGPAAFRPLPPLRLLLFLCIFCSECSVFFTIRLGLTQLLFSCRLFSFGGVGVNNNPGDPHAKLRGPETVLQGLRQGLQVHAGEDKGNTRLASVALRMVS